MNNSQSIGILHLIDTLTPGGAERMAVLLANHLPGYGFRVALCATRRGGALRNQIQPAVQVVELNRRGRWDLSAVGRLIHLIRRERIQLIHAHTTSLFLGALVCAFLPEVRLVWHDHFGRQDVENRPAWLYRWAALRASAVFAVTRDLARWSIHQLGLPADRVYFLPNFVENYVVKQPDIEPLPGIPGKRMVCVANVRHQKDHHNLLEAMRLVLQRVPDAHLLLVGAFSDARLTEELQQKSRDCGMARQISWLGVREDIPAVLAGCDIGVLSSASEGFPVVLLEYGRAGLGVVSTRVGECAEILDEGNAGILVPSGNPSALAEALLDLLEHPDRRTNLGNALAKRVREYYSPETVVPLVVKVYENILSGR